MVGFRERKDVAALHLRRMAAVALRPDVRSYCGDALWFFEGMPKVEVQRTILKIAMLESKGLSVNDPSKKYQLQSLPSDFTGLHLLCVEYVGFNVIDPTVDRPAPCQG